IHQHVFDVVGVIDEQRAEIEKPQLRNIAVIARELREKRERVAAAIAKQKCKRAAAGAGRKRIFRSFTHRSMLWVERRGAKNKISMHSTLRLHEARRCGMNCFSYRCRSLRS